MEGVIAKRTKRKNLITTAVSDKKNLFETATFTHLPKIKFERSIQQHCHIHKNNVRNSLENLIKFLEVARRGEQELPYCPFQLLAAALSRDTQP